MTKSNWVMDIETMQDLFCAVFIHYKSDEQHTFIVSRFQNDFLSLMKFLKQNKDNGEYHIAFNGLGFDSIIIQFILDNYKLMLGKDYSVITEMIYEKAQEVIDAAHSQRFYEFVPKKLMIKQVDVFKLNHWDNPAKSSSLKWIQYTMDWHNMEEMPIHHTELVDTIEKQDMIIMYCINDVLSTKQIMELSSSQINLRAALTKEYGIDLYSASEPRISKELFKHFLSAKTGISKYELNKLRTRRDKIVVNNIILDYIKFKTDVFNEILTKFKALVIDANNTKGAFSFSINYKGVQTDFGLGGVHGAKGGIYEAKEGMIIMSSDVTSFYPNLAIRNKWAPAHIPNSAFCDQYEWFFEERKKIPKKDPKNYVYKIILNSTYGLSNDENSFLYDPELTMRITINGQLSLMMLYEMLSEGIPGSIPIMQNTDGLEMMIPIHMKDRYLEICKEWEVITKLQLEHDQYQKMIIGDVNNYIGINTYRETEPEKYFELKNAKPEYLYINKSGKYLYAPTKCKGRFEFTDLAMHKNKSFLVIRKALYEFFVRGVDVKKFIENHDNIFDFCGGVKAKGDWKFYETCLIQGQIHKTPLSKIIRYYISNKGCKITKENRDGRIIQVESGRWLQKTLNQYSGEKPKDIDINYDYYINAAEREIKNIDPELISYRQYILF
jgi:hypothetical protein